MFELLSFGPKIYQNQNQFRFSLFPLSITNTVFFLVLKLEFDQASKFCFQKVKGAKKEKKRFQKSHIPNNLYLNGKLEYSKKNISTSIFTLSNDI